MRDHSSRDFGTGNLRYEEWKNAGLLQSSPGRSIDPELIALFIAELTQRYKVRGLAYDRWRIRDLLREFDRVGLEAHEDSPRHQDEMGLHRTLKTGEPDGLRIVSWGQGFRDMGPAVDALELAVAERQIRHPNHPILNWNIANAVAAVDSAGNRKLDKEKARWRIDGACALAMMMGLRNRDRTTNKQIDIEALIG
jgi:phage terminase large subunit-like protein